MYGLLFGVCFWFSVLLIIGILKVGNTIISKYLLIGTLLIAFWILMETLTYYIRVDTFAVLFQKLKYVSVCLIPPLYVLTAREYEDKGSKNIYLNGIIFVIPFLSFLSMVTNFIPYSFISNATVTYTQDIPKFIYHRELGFLIHTVYSYGCILFVCLTFLKKALMASRLYRLQSSYIFWGSVGAFIINIIAITTKHGPAYIDFTSISMLATLAILYWGLFHLPKAAVIPIARELLVENISNMTFTADSTGKIIDINQAAVNFIKEYGQYNLKSYGPSKNFIGVNMYEVLEFIPDLKLLEDNCNMPHESSIVYQSKGKIFYFRVYQSLIKDTDSSLMGRLFMVHDITQLQESVNDLKHLNSELVISDRIINSVLEGILITDANGMIIRINDSFEKMSGFARAELIGQNPRLLKSNIHDKEFYAKMWEHLIREGFWEGEIWDKKKNGEIYPKWMSITSLKQKEGKTENFIAVSTDITKIKKTEEDLFRSENYDSLTGIPNRTLFYERLEMALMRARDNERMAALLFMDLDGFKVINDTLGHATGDMLLKEVADRIKASIRKSDTVSRLGGDEFAVILEGPKSLEYIKDIADKIIAEIQRDYLFLDRELSMGISIGIALYPNDENTVEGLVRKADAALYDAKEAGKGRYSFSSESIEQRNREILEMQIKLKRALFNNEFHLYLQPQISYTEDGFQLVGAESLIRWKTSEGEFFTPDKFIPIAESNGMIIPIGNWILEEIFRIDRYLKSHGISIKLAINVSSRQLGNSDFAARVQEIMERNREQNINLVIEITESFLLTDLEKAIESMLTIQKLGIGIALDDFGTGFSSLSYLTKLPINYLKIDKSFIDDIADPARNNLTPSIISMAKVLGLQTIAEGVETQEQVNRLLTEECDLLQGYYFSKPVEINEFIRFTERFMPIKISEITEPILILK